jgi:microcystin degradation protein MlrC
MPHRVVLAGLFHETHTFLEGTTPLGDFSIRAGDDLLSAAGDGSPLGTVVQWGLARGWQFVPTIDVRATPSATVEDSVLEQFWHEFQSSGRAALANGVDGVFLVLHGAMVCESEADVEGEFLERLGRLAGAAAVPVCGVVDLHANFTARMAAHADLLIAYRENPHTDACEAALRAARHLEELMRSPGRLVTHWAHTRVMWPPTGTATADEPLRTIEAAARLWEAEDAGVAAVNVLPGFSFADTPDTGVSLSVVARADHADVDRRLAELTDLVWARRALGNRVDPPLSSVMPRLVEHREGPVLVVEPADNIGGGAPGDCTSVLRAFVEHDLEGAAVALNDPESVALVGDAPPGTRLTLRLGGKGSRLDPGPLELAVELVSRSDGRFALEDPHSHLASMCGSCWNMGPCAVVRHRGILVLLTSRKTPPFDLAQWRSQGIAPESLRVIAVKAAVAHRRAYDRIAKASYTVDTPGPCSSDLARFPFRRLRRPIYPLDPAWA